MQNEQSVPQNLILPPPKTMLHHLGNQGHTVIQTKNKKTKFRENSLEMFENQQLIEANTDNNNNNYKQ